MNTMEPDFTTAARAEAERAHFPVPATRAPSAIARASAAAFQDGASWARDHLARQEPTDAEVEAARSEIRGLLRDQYKDRYNLGRHASINIGDEIDIDETAEMVARAALTAAKEARA